VLTLQSSSRPLYKTTDIDDASSFGDDESDHGRNPLAHQADQDDMMLGLPDSLAGQGIEDLAYGAGPEFELEAHTLGIDWWGDSDDETEEDEEGVSFTTLLFDHLLIPRSILTTCPDPRPEGNLSRPRMILTQ
jgi:hypothetical protein